MSYYPETTHFVWTSPSAIIPDDSASNARDSRRVGLSTSLEDGGEAWSLDRIFVGVRFLLVAYVL